MVESKHGQRVRVIGTYREGQTGTTGTPYSHGGMDVLFDNGDYDGVYFPAELELVDVRVIEGVFSDDLGFLTIGGEYIGQPFRDLNGKKVFVTIEVREDSPSPPEEANP